ncbi:MAG TPA: type IX secretion system protein PorQ [Ignavibacteria bacterium]
MNILKSALLITTGFLFLTSANYAQNNTTYNFLKLDVDARSSAMAGNSVSVTNDVNGIFYNPATLTSLGKPQASIGFYKYLLDINSGNAAYTQKYKDIGYFGVGLRYFNYGTFDKYDESFNNLGTFSANDFALTLTYANKYIENLSYGASLKLIYSNIDIYKSTAVAADLGLLYQIPETQWNFGLSLLNIGTQISSYADTRENLPLDLRIGFNKRLEHLPLTFYFSISNLLDKKDKFLDRFKDVRLGGEFILSDNIYLRLGYNNQQRQDLKTGSATGIAGFSAGLGIKIEEKYLIDYAYNSLGKIGSTHRINVGFYLK